MVFSSFTFLALFLPAFLVVYNLIPSHLIRMKNVTLLAFSLFFYTAGEPVWVLLLIFSGLWDYFIGRFITNVSHQWQARALLSLSLCGNIGILFIFKYGTFTLAQFGMNVSFAATLPIGISFYTFQSLSYTIDLYRGIITKPQYDPIAFLSYVSMFPQLVAGPIIRYSDVEEKLTNRHVTATGFSDGITLFVMGLGKKIILANHAGKIADELLGAAPEYMSTGGVWLGSLMFMFQIYFDFSGYSNMAIGLGKMVGFDFKENFRHPYTAKSITDFWRRWHISLSSFFRDYIYIPMGGNRRHQILNLLVVWSVTGLWHGASWNFVLWGLYFGCILILEKYALKCFLQTAPDLLTRVYALLIILFGWVIFYFTDLSVLFEVSTKFFSITETFADHRAIELFFANIWIIPVLALFSTTIPIRLFAQLKQRIAITEPVYNAALFSASIAMLVGQTFNPFLYFRF